MRGAPVHNIRAAWWAVRAVREARTRLTRGGYEGFALSAPPKLSRSAGRGVELVLRRLEPTCLEGALVRQSWLAAHGDQPGVVVGVAGSSKDFRAHAWIEGDVDAAGDFVEIADARVIDELSLCPLEKTSGLSSGAAAASRSRRCHAPKIPDVVAPWRGR